jgi:ribosome biogenesis protein UTP30
MGEVFYKGHRKVPFMIQMAPINEDDLRKVKKQDRVERVDPEFVLKQMKSIAKNTYFFPSRDKSFQIKIGYVDMDPEKLTQNIGAVVEFLRNDKFAPAGGVLKKAGLKDLFVKTGDSASLPIWSKEK